MTDDLLPEPDQPESKKRDSDRPELDGPAPDAVAAEEASKAAASDTFEQAIDGLFESESAHHREPEEPAVEPEPAPKLERLQKILAQSGIASRRHAEELITQGRVQVNGKVVTELGTKADASRDHIRVDGKLLQGSERLRYFMLNKPKGFVTTVSDPEGRPTIMQFFSKMRERLYPVGRLDYLSEGLLLVTNDGDLANKLTRAAAGVEKTYLVKVSGQPSEEDIERLRQGVGIDRGKPGSGRVQTAPAEIRKFRPGRTAAGPRGGQRGGENPWYEVVLIEGRNRELRKMFEEIGHHVEKIRRVGYGPLVLDLEPGKLRELEPEEVENLRKASEGKYRKPKPREPRKQEFVKRPDRPASKSRWTDRRSDNRLSKDTGREERRPFRADRPSSDRRPESGGRRPGRDQFRGESPREFRPGNRSNPRFSEGRQQRPPRQQDRPDRPFNPSPESREGFAANRPSGRQERPNRFGSRPPRRDFGRSERPERTGFGSKPQQRPAGSGAFRGNRPDDRESPQRFDRPRGNNRGGPRSQDRPPRRDREEQPRFERPRKERSQHREDRPGRPDRSSSQRSSANRPDQRASAPRSGGNYRPAKRGGPAGKQGSVRSSGGRRPNSRPGGNRGNKRRP